MTKQFVNNAVVQEMVVFRKPPVDQAVQMKRHEIVLDYNLKRLWHNGQSKMRCSKIYGEYQTKLFKNCRSNKM